MCHSVRVKSKNKLQELILSFHIVVGGFLIAPMRSNPGYIVHEFPKNCPVSTSHFTVKYWDYRYAPPHLAFSFLSFFFLEGGGCGTQVRIRLTQQAFYQLSISPVISLVLLLSEIIWIIIH